MASLVLAHIWPVSRVEFFAPLSNFYVILRLPPLLSAKLDHFKTSELYLRVTGTFGRARDPATWPTTRRSPPLL
jgi:hypothetical protein